jgi:hypothetical protein
MPGFVPFQLRTAKKVRARIKVRRIEKGYLEKGGSAVVRKMGCYARQYEEGRLGCEDALLQRLCIGIKISISVYKGYGACQPPMLVVGILQRGGALYRSHESG